LTGSGWCRAEVPHSDWTLKQWQHVDTYVNVRVLAYNLFWWNLFGLRGGNEKSAGKLIQQNFQSEPFAVMALQECDSVARLLKDAELDTRYIGIQGRHALSIAYDGSQWEELRQGSADVAEDRPEQYFGRRAIQWVRLRHKRSRKTILAVNHHGPLPVPSGGVCGGSATAYNILRETTNNAEHGDLIVLAGDFNSLLLSETVQKLQEHVHWLYTGKSFGGVDHFFSNYDDSYVRERRNLGNGGSDHDALSVTFRI